MIEGARSRQDTLQSPLSRPGTVKTVEPSRGRPRRWLGVKRLLGGAVVNQLATQICLRDLNVFHSRFGTRQNILLENDEIRELLRFERALLLFFERQERIVDRVQPDRLRARQALLGMQWLVGPPGHARQRDPHSQKRI